jgi:AraC-like DNA-binding protein
MSGGRKTIPIYKIGQHCESVGLEYFKITSFDVEACTATEFLEHHRHEYYEIVWLKNGQGIHHIDSQSYPYLGSVIFLLSPGQVHRLFQNQKADGYVIKFLPEIFRDQKDVNDFLFSSGLFDNIDTHPVIKLTANQYSNFQDLFDRINIEYNTDDAGRDQILSSYLKILLTYITRLKQLQLDKKNQKLDVRYEMFRNYKIEIEKNFHHRHDVGFYAELLSTQPRTLNSIAKKYSGRSAIQLITDRLILEAKRHLHHGALAMKEISFTLGFEDPAYFNRFFKKHVGTAPHQYKIQSQLQAEKTPAA